MRYGSVEEAYEYNTSRYAMPKCDVCNQRTTSNRIHLMKRFQDDNEILVCSHCLDRLKEDDK